MGSIAKIFMNGRSQAVRLPQEFRFNTKEVFIRKDELTGDVILSARPTSWANLIEMLELYQAPEDFLNENERNQNSLLKDPFDEWVE